MMLETSTVKNAPTPAASPRPDPPRYWWLRRLAVVGVLIVVGLAGLRGWWGREAQRRIDAIIAQAQRRGEPILPGDFVTPGNAGSVNPVVTLARTFSWSAPEQAFVNTFNRNAQPTAADRAMIRGIMKAHAAALAQVRAARGLIGTDEVAPPKNVRSEVVHLNAWRNLAEVLGLCAVEAHCVGNDAGALEYIRDLGTVANAVTDENLYLLSYLVAGGITSIESDSAVQLAETLTIAPDGSATPSGAASQTQVRSLIADLLDERRRQAMGVRVWEIERSMALRAEDDDADMQIQPPDLAYLGLPIFRLARVREARELGPAIAAARQTQFPAAINAAAPVIPYNPLSILENVATGGPNWVYGPQYSAFRAIYAGLLTRRVGATALAIRLYAVDHEGRFPETLQQLVPAYLPTVPVDPFAADGRPLRYVPHRNPPVIYSVGDNGIDDGGAAKWPAGPDFPSSVWGAADIVFPLRHPTTAPTTSPVR
ncbi:MAG TPA: hypothetical protein VFC78_16930 [Tepidisphaeraceae bacterium]|nr:hypothetical protein [Tepidisphaeraceae bacterium]